MSTNKDMRTFIGFSTSDYRMAKSLSEAERELLGIDLDAIEKGLRAQGASEDLFKSTPIGEKIQAKRDFVEAKEHEIAERNTPKISE